MRHETSAPRSRLLDISQHVDQLAALSTLSVDDAGR
ncbi:hypothetical protein BCL80_11537 [Streptomyces avidinii]|nr:hypothetical protein BCL80_11537 [Streptomyces avidinii]SNX80842.1 hypothetical protein SAMN05421860_11337 [Streptomyces microflavus]